MAGIKEEKKIYLVGIYCRLSKDDGTDNESASIATQKSILTDYVKKQGWHIAKTYVDDGYSGTNFQRLKCTLCQGHYDFSFSDFYFIFVCCVVASK